MIRNMVRFALCLSLICCVLQVYAQQPAASGIVPQVVKFGGVLTDVNGKPLTGTVGVTFSLYKDQEGGAPLWMETQNVQPDKAGHYSVMLGSATSQGLPASTFASGEARWLGVRAQGEAEQPRTVLMSVPYALKAADAETIGGLPPSAFMLAVPPSSNGGSISNDGTSSSASAAPPTTSKVTTTGGTVNALPLWTTSTNVQSSTITQTGSGPTAKIGIGTSAPSVTLDVKGAETVRGALTLPATGTATATAGKNSQPQNLVASSFNSSISTAVNQTFQWQAESAANNTSHPSGTLNLLYGLGASQPGETGLKLSNKGLFTFAPGQTFPGTGDGTVTSVGFSAPSSDFKVSGSPVTSQGTLGLSWTVAPTSANTVSSIVKRDSSGSFSAGVITATEVSAAATGSGYGVIGTSPSGIGVYGESNSFVGVNGLSSTGVGVYGFSDSNIGVSGESENGNGVDGIAHNNAGAGVFGTNLDSNGNGVYGTGNGFGVLGQSSSPTGSGGGFGNSSTGDALFTYNQSGGFAAFFDGDVDVDGNLSKAAGSFKIDDPLDPANKYLYHSFVESPDMMNIYNGNATTDGQGSAVVQLPEWFEALNRDFRYQLTVIGQFAQAIVASKVSNHQFAIKTDKPNVEVSWQVTGIRQDAWASAHRIPVEVPKAERDRGLYLHPELFGAPAEKNIGLAHHPMMQKLLKQSAAAK
jgi:hypothetical protein